MRMVSAMAKLVSARSLFPSCRRDTYTTELQADRQRRPPEVETMSRVVLGCICGLVYGALSAASMIPLEFPDKRAALLGAFLNSFGIGFVTAVVDLPLPGWATGAFLGLMLSLPDAIITKAYVPILVFGVVGGAIIGIIVAKWGAR